LLVESSSNTSTLDSAASLGSILEVLRTVAKTRCPRLAKEKARAEPMPPVLQPVIRTVGWGWEGIVLVNTWRVGSEERKGEERLTGYDEG
jgi:hypothetical protein